MEKWVIALQGVSFPVNSNSQIYAGLPKGPDSNISVGGIVVCNTEELLERFLKPTDFPIQSAEDLIGVVLDRAGIL